MIRRSFYSSSCSSATSFLPAALFSSASTFAAGGGVPVGLCFSKRLQSSAAGSGSADYYSLLGVSPTASADEIKKAYREKAKSTHPDRPGGNEEQFKKVSEAFGVLSNAEKKQQYDAMRSFGGGRPGAAGGGGGNPFAQQQYQQTGRTASWSPMGGGVNDPYRSPPGGQPFNFGNFDNTSMSREEADNMFRSIFGGQTLDQIFQATAGSAPRSSTTKQNPDGSYTTDSTYRTRDGRTVRISKTFEKSGSSGGAGPGQQYGGDQQQGQGMNNPFNAGPFSSGPFGQRSPFSGGGEGSTNPFGGGGGGNPFAAGRPGGAGAGPFSGLGGGNPFMNFGGNSGTGGAFASGPQQGGGGGGQYEQQQQQQQQGSYGGHQQRTTPHPFSSSYWFRANPFRGTPFAGFFYQYPMVRLIALNLVIIFVLSALFSFTFSHPLVFAIMVFLLWISRARL